MMSEERIVAAIQEGLTPLTEALSKLSYGGSDGPPTGLEALAISIAGYGLKTSLGEIVEEGCEKIATGLNNLADAIREANQK